MEVTPSPHAVGQSAHATLAFPNTMSSLTNRPYPVQPPMATMAPPTAVPVTFVSLVEVVRSHSVETLELYLKHNSAPVNDPGWLGFTLLHNACLRGNLPIVRTLLHYGANPNAPNNAGETPVHLSCHQSAPLLLMCLVSFGGDVMVADGSGNTCIHHAAQRGVISVIHYLHIVHKVDLDSTNKRLQTPLHLAAIGRYLGVVSFLHKQKCNLICTDDEGNSALHIAAKDGLSVICWELVQGKGASMLHHKNHQGYTPADLAATQSSNRTMDMSFWLTKWKVEHGESGTVRRPWLAWHLLLWLPLVWYSASLSLGWYFIPESQLYVVGPSLLGLARFMLKQQHRQVHPSRTPNPIHASLFISGIAISILCYFFHIQPFYYCPWWLTALTMAFTATLVVTLALLLIENPGMVCESVVSPDLFYQECARLSFISEQQPDLQFCEECQLVVSKRTKHCKLCDCCFQDLDHHCLFLLRCIARNNHRLFITFLIALLVSIVLFINSVLFTLSSKQPEVSLTILFGACLWNDAWTASLVLVSALSGLWTTSLIRFQLSLISEGHTASIRDYRIYKIDGMSLTISQQFRNIVRFMWRGRAFNLPDLSSEVVSLKVADQH